MTKSELIDHVFQQLGGDVASKVSTEKIINAAFEAIAEGLNKDRAVNIVGFGSFAVQHRPERQGRNPATGQSITIAASNAVKFKPGKSLTERVNA